MYPADPIRSRGRRASIALAVAAAAASATLLSGAALVPASQTATGSTPDAATELSAAERANLAAAGANGAQASCPGDPIMAAYYRTWRDVAAVQPGSESNAAVMSDLPAGVDIAFVFNAEGAENTDYFPTLRDEYVPALHAQGTQVVRTIGIHDLLDLPVQTTDAGYDQLAQQLIAEYVTADGLDGLDVDVEQVLTTSQVQHAGRIFEALAEYLGPTSGTDTLLIYDTNMNGTEPLFDRVAPHISYVMVQSYGRSVSGLQSTWNTFAPRISSCQYTIGFSFYEERGARWGDTLTPFSTSRAASYARWQPTGGVNGGIFSYAVDRDWKAQGDDTITAPTYSWTQQLIAIQEGTTP